MVWGGITYSGKTDLVVVDGNLTAPGYIDQILTPHVVPFFRNNGPGLIFQQDNATCHTARLAKDYLQQQQIETLPWPAKSADLNPIEHLWDELDRRLRKRPNPPQTLQDLSQALVEEWNNVPQYRIRRLISSMRRRCQAVIAVQGDNTRY